MILRTEIYATACIIGGIVHATAFYTFHMPLQQAMMLGMIITRPFGWRPSAGTSNCPPLFSNAEPSPCGRRLATPRR